MRKHLGPLIACAAYLAGLLVRYQYIFQWHPAEKYLFGDMAWYFHAAQNWFNPGYLPTLMDTLYPPGAGYFFGWLMHWDPSFFLVHLAQFVLSGLVPVLLALIGRELFGRKVALTVLALASLYFPFIDYAGYFLAEGPFLFLLVLFFWLFTRGIRTRMWVSFAHALLAGVALGLAAAFKSVALAVGLALLLALVFLKWRKWPHPIARPILGGCVGLLILLFPLATRATTLSGGHFCLIAHDWPGYFLLGHYGDIQQADFDDREKLFPLYTVQTPGLFNRTEPPASFRFNPCDTKQIVAATVAKIRGDPGQALLLSVEHVFELAFYNLPWPSGLDPALRPWIDLFHRVFMLLLLLPLATHLWLNRQKLLQAEGGGELLALAPLLALCAAAFVLVGEQRDRIPFDGFAILLAARFYCGGAGAEPACGGCSAKSSGLAEPRA